MGTRAADHVEERQPEAPVRLRPVEAPPRDDAARVPVLVIDPRPLTREWLAGWLQTGPAGFRVTAAADPGDLDGAGDDPVEAELVVLNIGGAAFADAAARDAVAALARRCPGVPVVLFAERGEVVQIAAALRHGVRGYITPGLSPGVVVEALRLVRAGGTFVPAEAVVAAVRHEPQAASSAPIAAGREPEGFTPRELEVLDRLRRGLPNKLIAHELDICDNTVKVHVKHVMRKLGATNRTQAALLARRLFDDRE